MQSSVKKVRAHASVHSYISIKVNKQAEEKIFQAGLGIKDVGLNVH